MSVHPGGDNAIRTGAELAEQAARAVAMVTCEIAIDRALDDATIDRLSPAFRIVERTVSKMQPWPHWSAFA